MRKVLTTLFLLSFFILKGCISYTDSRVKGLDASQTVTINLDISLKVLEIDGKKGPPNWLTAVDELKLPPGKHTFKIIWDNVDYKTTPITFEANLEPGETYDLHRTMDFENKTWSFKLEKAMETEKSN